MDLINSAFRKAESFIIDRDRVDLEVVQSLLANGEFLVADDECALAGCVYLEFRGERAYLGLLSVDPARQKAGVGSMLMREAELHCARAGCRFMDLRIIDLRRTITLSTNAAATLRPAASLFLPTWTPSCLATL